jgi:N-acetylglucosamine-6-sulfatase
LTGLYAHNVKTINNTKEGGCYSKEWIKTHEKNTLPVILKKSGYSTFYAGKYLNQYYSKDVPPGYDYFYGLHGNSKYYNYTLNENGNIVEYGDNPEEYYTNVIKNQTKEFFKLQTKEKPFFAMVSTPACHAPFQPEDKYINAMIDFKAPRSPNFNKPSDPMQKHWLMNMKPHVLSEKTIELIDEYYHLRLETLMSVDDMIEEFVEQLTEQNLLDETFIIFTSDNGYHLGNFGMPFDKRLPYESDIKVPLIVSGPTIPIKKSIINAPVVLIDLLPTILDLSKIPYNISNYDGQSFANLLSIEPVEKINQRQILIEHFGEGNADTYNIECPWKKSQKLSGCTILAECKCQDSSNNTYACVKHYDEDTNFIYCSFHDHEMFHEAYDLNTDQFQLDNVAYDILTSMQAKYQIIVDDLKNCEGDDCRKYREV